MVVLGHRRAGDDRGFGFGPGRCAARVRVRGLVVLREQRLGRVHLTGGRLGHADALGRYVHLHRLGRRGAHVQLRGPADQMGESRRHRGGDLHLRRRRRGRDGRLARRLGGHVQLFQRPALDDRRAGQPHHNVRDVLGRFGDDHRPDRCGHHVRVHLEPADGRDESGCEHSVHVHQGPGADGAGGQRAGGHGQCGSGDRLDAGADGRSDRGAGRVHRLQRQYRADVVQRVRAAGAGAQRAPAASRPKRTTPAVI